MTDPIKVLVVDDSATMRSIVTATLEASPGIKVIGQAADPFEARDMVKALNPDVLTLDVEMPRMSGIEFLDRIMRLRPMPVVMVSTLTAAGTTTSVEALALGAVACVAKPDFSGLVEAVRVASVSRVRRRETSSPAPVAVPDRYQPGNRVLAIGSSTGGVEALSTMLAGFPANCPPTVITQHMPATFTGSFAARLDRTIAPQVLEARDGAPLKPGVIYIAPGGPAHLEIAGRHQLACRLVEGDTINGHRPSVDALFHSVAHHIGSRGVGVILTGMGKDGAAGLLAMRQAGARTIGQDAESSVVYGMPRVAAEIGAVESQLPLAKIGSAALRLCAAPKVEAA